MSVNGSTFDARLIDLTGNQPDQEATIRTAEVSSKDQARIQSEAIFYWYVGYRDGLDGERERASKFYFRRLPQITEAEQERARGIGAARRARLGW